MAEVCRSDPRPTPLFHLETRLTTIPAIDAAREALAAAEAAVETARDRLRGALADHDARGVSDSATYDYNAHRDTTAAAGRAEAQRRLAARRSS